MNKQPHLELKNIFMDASTSSQQEIRAAKINRLHLQDIKSAHHHKRRQHAFRISNRRNIHSTLDSQLMQKKFNKDVEDVLGDNFMKHKSQQRSFKRRTTARAKKSSMN